MNVFERIELRNRLLWIALNTQDREKQRRLLNLLYVDKNITDEALRQAAGEVA